MIRDAVSGDAESLTGLMLGSAAYGGTYHAIIADYPVTSAMIADGIVRVAEDAGCLHGFYRLDLKQAELDLMFVADPAQGSGIGRSLFDDMVEQARLAGLQTIRIVAHPPAADFYRRMGSVDVGVCLPQGRATWSRPILRLDITA